MSEKWRRFPWLPARALPVNGEPGGGSLPIARWALLGAAAVGAVLAAAVNPGFAPPWWLLTGAALLVAVLAYFTRRKGITPWGGSWLVRREDRVGLVETGAPTERSVTAVWLDTATMTVAQGLRARAVLTAAAGVLTASGRDPGFHGFPADEVEDPEELPDTAGHVVAWDGSGAFWVSSREHREAVLGELGAVPEPVRTGTLTPLDFRITRQDLRTIAFSGVASAAMLETVFGAHSPPDETDHALDPGLTRCWPSRIDGLSVAELHELGRERILAALRADLAAQLDRDRDAEPSAAEWAKRWTERLDALALKEDLDEAPAPETTGERPALSTVARAALLVCASSTDAHAAPMRADLASLGVPAGPGTELLWAGSPAWRTANALVNVLTVLIVLGALTALFDQ